MNSTVRYESIDSRGYAKAETVTGEVLDEHPKLCIVEHDHGTTKVPWTNVIDIYELKG
ncbi:hypothetical protein JZX82_gp55 [Gordonia phage William]|uniref:Uncharacterized protein n=1 Tax=Gordonia phage William TaxID=2571253 RepID=A0A4Y6EEQ3_9CAUD|nr:hypothetical protein JZX82_gp55 [Gordonia phage William]QDF17150.1 hypothetical protein SEA_WILLIAM_55 [Gordonia phage William]